MRQPLLRARYIIEMRSQRKKYLPQYDVGYLEPSSLPWMDVHRDSKNALIFFLFGVLILLFSLKCTSLGIHMFNFVQGTLSTAALRKRNMKLAEPDYDYDYMNMIRDERIQFKLNFTKIVNSMYSVSIQSNCCNSRPKLLEANS